MTQSVTPRAELPAAFVAWADKCLGERLDAVVFDITDPDTLFLHGADGKILTFAR